MKLMLPVVIMTAVCGLGTSDLPRPWLSLDRTATVLHLRCRLPPESSYWQAVYDLRLYAFLPQHSRTGNVSLVNMTSDWKEPRVNPKFSISQASFQGDWGSKSVSLDFVIPVTDKELGQYFCVVDYLDNKDRLPKFSTRVLVDKDFVFSHIETAPKTEQNFEVHVMDAHKVHITWTKPKHSKFTEASVSRVLTGDGEKSISNSMSLFTTNGDADLVYGSQVLLRNLSKTDSGNMSITLYVKKDQHSANYRYSCRVPYPACTGQTAVLCTCCQQGSNPDRQTCSNMFFTSPEACKSYFTEFIIALVIAVILWFILAFVVIYVVLKNESTRPRTGCSQEEIAPLNGASPPDGHETEGSQEETGPLNGASPSDVHETEGSCVAIPDSSTDQIQENQNIPESNDDVDLVNERPPLRS